MEGSKLAECCVDLDGYLLLMGLKTVVHRQIISDSVTVFKVPLSMAFCTEQDHV